jgi:formate dehydrogenase alpha subunit
MGETVTITLNGREVSGHSGMTIFELAREMGVAIPTLCHDSHLRAIGSCRVCLVEDEKRGTLHAACVTPIAPGMVINTTTLRVINHRKTVVKLMLASHPDSCVVCDKGNRCKLRAIAADLGIGLVDFYRMPHYSEHVEVNPFIQRDLSKCILCGKCIRADHELVVVGAIEYIHRGFDAKPTTLFDKPLEASACTFCGTCVSVCPTGALAEKGKKQQGTVSREIATVCPFCGCGCALMLGAKEGTVVEVKPQVTQSVNQLTLCVRGHYGIDFIHHQSRVGKPLVKKNGTLEEVAWEEAFGFVVSRLQEMNVNGECVGVIGSPTLTNEEHYLLQKFARGVLHTNHIDHGGRLYATSSQVGLMMSLGWGAMTNTFADLKDMDLILLIGAHPTESAPLLGYKIKRTVREKGTKLIVIDPIVNTLSKFAWKWLRPKVGSDFALIQGLIQIVLTENLFDKESVTRRVKTFKKIKNGVKRFTPQKVEALTGIVVKELREVARAFAHAEKVAVIYGNGIMQQHQSAQSVIALADLVLLGGKLKKGGGIYPLLRDCNVQGASDMGMLPDLLPGFQNVDDREGIKRFENIWGAKIPREKGWTLFELIQKAKEGMVQGLYVVGENPVRSFPDGKLVEKALSTLKLLIVQDLFLTETAMRADVVLPAASFAEKDGTFTSMERRIQRVRKAIEPIGESKADWQIIAELSAHMGYPMRYDSPENIMDEIAGLVPSYSGVSYRRLETEELFWPCPGNGKPIVKRLYQDGFPEGKGVPLCLDGVSIGMSESCASPLYLVVGSSLYEQGSGTRTEKSSILRKMRSDFVEMHPEDLIAHNLDNGCRVKISSPIGECESRVKANPLVAKGVVYAPLSLNGGEINRLIPLTLETLSKTPELKMCPITIGRTE